jgi:hypothetical protein
MSSLCASSVVVAHPHRRFSPQPLWIIPAVYAPSARNTPKDRLVSIPSSNVPVEADHTSLSQRLFHLLSTQAAKTMGVLVPSLTVLLAYSAYAVKRVESSLTSNFWARNRSVRPHFPLFFHLYRANVLTNKLADSPGACSRQHVLGRSLDGRWNEGCVRSDSRCCGED